MAGSSCESQIHISQGEGQSADSARKEVKRSLRKAQNLAKNVAVGEFRGE